MPNILIAVVGTSPAVVTETLQALANEGTEIHKMHIVTTTIGKEKLFDALRTKGHFSQLCREYPGDEEHAKIADSLLDMDQEHCCIPRDHLDRKELADITSEEDATLMADHICELVRLKTDKPENRVFASIAGGRKTMSFWLGCAMSLFGRPGDKLMHVLVNEPFESCEDFFYKPKGPTKVRVTDDVPSKKYKKHDMVSTDIADIALGEVPFPQLRPLLKKTHWLDLETEIDVGKIMSEINLAAAGPSLVFHDEKKTIDFGEGRSLETSAPRYAVYKLCAQVAAGEAPAGSPAAGTRLLTIDDFTLGNRWATIRLKILLDRFSDSGELTKSLANIVDTWEEDDGDAWLNDWRIQQASLSARSERDRTEKRKQKADKKISTAKGNLDAAADALEHAKLAAKKASEALDDVDRMHKSLADREEAVKALAQAKAELTRAQSKHAAAQAGAASAVVDQGTLEATHKLAIERAVALEKQLAADPLTANRLAQVETIRFALRQVRNRVNEMIEDRFGDPGLRSMLKLTQRQDIFEIGLSEEFRTNPSRIQFLP